MGNTWGMIRKPEKKEVYKVGTMTEGKRNLIAGLLSESNYRNGTKSKRVRSKYGELSIMYPGRLPE